MLAVGLLAFAAILSIMNAAATGMAWQCYKDGNKGDTAVKFLLTIMILNVLAVLLFGFGAFKSV
jgi:hypothetical protein